MAASGGDPPRHPHPASPPPHQSATAAGGGSGSGGADAEAAEAERTRAVLAAKLSEYRAAYYRALVEVEDALSSERREAERMVHIRTELSVARNLLERSRERYSQGLSDYLPVLNALQSVQRIDRNLLTATRTLLSHRIRLYRALGGTWTDSLRHKIAAP